MNDEPQTTVIADPGSLENLHDIVLPEPVAWWPPATGWYVLLLLLGLLAVILIGLAVHRWWSRRYRRAALAELEVIRESSADHPSFEAVAAIDRLLKRVALAAWPRSTVANLSGERWLNFLRQTSASGTQVSAQTKGKSDWASDLCDLVYSKRKRDKFGPEQMKSLVAAADRWIRTHQVEQHSGLTSAEDHQ